MKYRIIWKKKAQNDYLKIVEYLREEYGRKSATKFINRVDTVSENIMRFPYAYPSSKKKNIRKAFINKNTSMYYRVHENSAVEFLFFWNNRRNPDDLPI